MRGLWNFLLRQFGVLAALVEHALKPLGPYQEPAYQLVKRAAQITKERTVQSVEVLAQSYGVPVQVDGVLSQDELGAIIQKIVLTVLQRQFPEAPTRQLNRAIEIGVGMVRP